MVTVIDRQTLHRRDKRLGRCDWNDVDGFRAGGRKDFVPVVPGAGLYDEGCAIVVGEGVARYREYVLRSAVSTVKTVRVGVGGVVGERRHFLVDFLWGDELMRWWVNGAERDEKRENRR